MCLKSPPVNTSSLCPDGCDGKTVSRVWRKLARITTGVFIGFTLTEALLFSCESLAGEPPRPALRLSTWLDQNVCAATPNVLRLSPEVALGLVAFNSPYLFGGKALRSQLTCGACHDKDGPSGAAVRLRLRAPVPDLRAVAHRTDVAAFADRSVVAEFDGPPLPRRTARALAALADVLAPYASDPAKMCHVDAATLVTIGLRLSVARISAADGDTDELDFLLDSLRFVLGEMARGTPPGGTASLLDEINRALHDAIPLVDHANGRAALVTLQSLANRWDAASDRPHFVLASSTLPANE
jgi:hypothetical protein